MYLNVADARCRHRTCQERYPLGTDGERESKESMLIACLNDVDDVIKNLHAILPRYRCTHTKMKS